MTTAWMITVVVTHYGPMGPQSVSKKVQLYNIWCYINHIICLERL